MSNANQRYAGQCECGREVSKRFAIRIGKTPPPMRRVRCANCDSIVPTEPEGNTMETA